MKENVQQPPAKTLRYRAMDLLTRREHSAAELAQKLSAQFPDEADLVPEVLAGLQRDNLQSDQRFAEALLVSRIRRGQGPYRIRQELQQRGVSGELIGEALANCDVDWFQLAADVMARKYGSAPCGDYRERARRSRFLQYRGFSSEQIQSCFGDD